MCQGETGERTAGATLERSSERELEVKREVGGDWWKEERRKEK
jgi:hypothetical protein